MRAIWKFEVTPTDRFVIDMPKEAKLLAVQVQHGVPQLWAEVDTDNAKEYRTFAIYGTGNMLPSDPGKYVGTFQDGIFVWHLYEINEQAEANSRNFIGS